MITKDATRNLFRHWIINYYLQQEGLKLFCVNISCHVALMVAGI